MFFIILSNGYYVVRTNNYEIILTLLLKKRKVLGISLHLGVQ